MNVHLQRLFIPLAYVFIFILLTYLVVIWRRSKKSEQEKQRLEQVIKERTREVEDKNKQLEILTVRLRLKKKKLEELDRVKSRFFSHISHEFRSPLTLIMLPLEHMLENCMDKKTEEGLNLMLRNSQQLLTLVNQLPNIFDRFLQEGSEEKSIEHRQKKDMAMGNN